MEEKKILIISGPTASGKSALAKQIAIRKNGIIINADSIQLYKELPILSSQPSFEDLQAVTHLLYSQLKYNEKSSVALWLKLAQQAIEESFAMNKLPIIVGGTGLYISSLINGISNIPEISPQTQKFCRNLYEEIDRESFIQQLIELGEDKAKVENLDKQRLIRSMEVIKQTGKTIAWWHQNNAKSNNTKYKNFIHINLEPNRQELYDNCNKRFEEMLNNGAIEEVKEFIKLNPNDELPISKTIGYFEIRDYLAGEISKEDLIEKSCKKTRNYAKRQLTWFRNQFQKKITFQNAQNRQTLEQIINLLS